MRANAVGIRRRLARLEAADEAAVRQLADWFMRASDEKPDKPTADDSLAEARWIRAGIRRLHGRFPWAVVEALAGADWATFHGLVEDFGIDRVELARAVGRVLGTPRERVEELLERQQRDESAPSDETPL